MKGKVKRVLSGMLSVMTIMTSIIQPITIYAAETEPAAYEAEYLTLEKVKDNLGEKEVVQVQDYEVEVGSSFDVKTDFSGMKINSEKVKVTFHEAKNESGQDFDVNHVDSYKAVYFVEPFSKNPSYHVTRKIIVKEPTTEAQTEKSSDSGGNSGQTGESESEEDSEPHSEIQSETEVTEPETVQAENETEALSEAELDAALEAAEEQDTVDEESGLSLGNVMLQAVEQGTDLLEMEEGETVTFMAQAPALFSARASQNVTVTRGSWYYYADYGLGTYLTAPYTVTFGNVTATAYCVQPSKPGPDDGNYTITKLADGKTLAKVCYYGTKASDDEGFFAEKHPEFSAGKRFIITHLAASYANGSSDAFSGTNSTGQSLAMELYNYCVNQPEIPDVAMSFSKANVTAYVEGNEQRTEVITFQADTLQTITMKLPVGVKFHNVTTGNTSKAGAEVEVSGGTKFYLSAPLTQTADVSDSWSATMKGSITKDYSAYKITTGSSTQDLALVFGEGVTDEKYVDFSVKWVELAKVGVVKVDSKHQDAKLSDAVFGIYSDKNCTQLITQMPATDNNGSSVVEIVKTQDTVYLKEITAPKGYRINTTAFNVKLVANQTVTTTVPDEEQLGELTVYKEGQVLTGADVTDAGVIFRYENRRQEGAVYDVYAGEDIYTAYGALVYKKGDLVKENLTTDSNGAVILKNLHLGTYLVRETQAPKNFYNSGEEKKITLSYAGQNVEVIFSETTFTNDRQKAKVMVQKLDQDTRNPLDGGIFGMYSGSDITAWDGTVIVKKGTLIEKAVTGEDGIAAFTADLPIGFRYEVKEEQAPEGFLSAVAEMEHENITVQFMAARMQKLMSGGWPGGGVPYGYVSVNKELVVVPKVADLMRLIYQKYLEPDMKLNTVVGWLNENGYKRVVKGEDKVITSDFVSSVLGNLVYYGMIVYNRRTNSEEIKRNPKEIISVRGKHEAIIPEDIWMQVQEKRRRLRKPQKKVDDPERSSLLAGLVKCPVCGTGLIMKKSKRKNSNHGDYYKIVYSYGCRNYRKSAGRVCNCRRTYNQDKLDRAVVSLAATLIRMAEEEIF